MNILCAWNWLFETFVRNEKPLLQPLVCIGLLITLMVFAVSALASKPVSDVTSAYTCDKSKQESLSDYYRFAVNCGGLANMGFSTSWVPGNAQSQISLATPPAGVYVSAYWAKAAEFDDKLDELRKLTSKYQDSDVDSELHEKHISNIFKSISEKFEHYNIIDQSDKNGIRTVILETPGTGWEFYPVYQLLLVGHEDNNAKFAFVSLARTNISSVNWTNTIAVILGITGFIILFTGLHSTRRWFAGPSGRLSLASVQIWFFSVIVIIVSAYIFLETGTLGDISKDVLLLIGIAGVGGSAAKIGDRFTQRLSWDNWLWLRNEGWLPEKPEYKLGQLIQDSAGDFDVFRFQALSFSLLVSVYLLVSGLSGLGAIDLPDTIMGLLGLSQVTYIGGKAAAPPKFTDFDKQLATYREELKQKGAADASVQEKGRKAEQAFEVIFGHKAKP